MRRRASSLAAARPRGLARYAGWALAVVGALHALPWAAHAQPESADALTAATPSAAEAPGDPSLPPPYAPATPAEGTIIEVPVAGAVYDTPPAEAPTAARRERRRARWAPPRSVGHRVSLDVIGFGGDVGGAAFAGDWRFRAPRAFFVLTRLGPFALSKAGPDRIGVADASFVLGFDSRLFAAGAGVGLTYLRIDETVRRSEGLAAVGHLHLRAGALDGLHVELDIGGTLVDQTAVGTHANLRFRFPLRRGRLLDVIFDVMPAASWVQLQAGLIMRIPWLPDSPWRLRPHVGLVEIIDAIGRDGGAGLGVGLQLIYLGDATPADSR